MAIIFPDANPTATSNDKVVHQKTVRLTSADFTTAGAASVKAVLPADSSILGFSQWTNVQLAGGGITAATLSVGVAGAPAKFLSAVTAFGAAGAYVWPATQTNILQAYNLPLGPDISLLFTGTATTGNPTSGEIYVTIWYVR